MASFNQMVVVGYLTADPKIIGEQYVYLKMMTSRRGVVSSDSNIFEEIFVYYDGAGSKTLFERMCKLKAFDFIYIKGVVTILRVSRSIICPFCSAKHIKDNSIQTMLYPLFMEKKDNFMITVSEHGRADFPNERLHDFQEISHQLTLMGTVVSDPELNDSGDTAICRYHLGIDRKYYIKTQDDITADYPWIYSYGEQAVWDKRHLVSANKEKGELGSLILLDGFMHNSMRTGRLVCDNCHHEITYKYPSTVFTPYHVEYLNRYKTDADIAMEQELLRRKLINGEA